MSARRKHRAWVEAACMTAIQHDAGLCQQHRAKCSCEWRSEPTGYPEAQTLRDLHLSLHDLSKAQLQELLR